MAFPAPRPVINRFEGPYDWLSNFYERPFELDGRTWPTVEHYFQAMKTMDRRQQEWIRESPDPSTAKRRGRKATLRGGWARYRHEVMFRALEAKFRQHPDLQERLLATRNAYLEEGNNWGDAYWGTVEAVGFNYLGFLLMEVRTRLQDEADGLPRRDEPPEPPRQP